MNVKVSNARGTLDGNTFDNLDYEDIRNKFSRHASKLDRLEKEVN